MIRKILKKLYLLFFCNFFIKYRFNEFGKKSFIREHRLIHGKKYISIKENVKIYPYCRLECYDEYCGKKYNPSIVISNNVMINRNFTCLSAGNVFIGSNCSFGSNCFITNENHGTNPKLNYLYQPLLTKDVVIDENCWIGEKTIILPGVHIGKNSIVGAGSVVTRDIPEYSIAVGNPAKVIKRWNEKENTWKKI